MSRVFSIALVLGLAACAGEPTFEDQLQGTWVCEPAVPNPAMLQTQTFTYAADGTISGSVTFTEKTEGVIAILSDTVAGKWLHKDGKVLHTLTEEFEQLQVDGELVPTDEVNPMIVASFRPETTYDVTVDLKEDTLTWYEDAKKTEKLANCTRQSGK